MVWTTPFVKALVRWATGKRLTNRLPKLNHETSIGHKCVVVVTATAAVVGGTKEL